MRIARSWVQTASRLRVAWHELLSRTEDLYSSVSCAPYQRHQKGRFGGRWGRLTIGWVLAATKALISATGSAQFSARSADQLSTPLELLTWLRFTAGPLVSDGGSELCSRQCARASSGCTSAIVFAAGRVCCARTMYRHTCPRGFGRNGWPCSLLCVAPNCGWSVDLLARGQIGRSLKRSLMHNGGLS
ncbi:hypothetical protein ABMB68_009047 [Bradyrhizobium sp. RT4a]